MQLQIFTNSKLKNSEINLNDDIAIIRSSEPKSPMKWGQSQLRHGVVYEPKNVYSRVRILESSDL